MLTQPDWPRKGRRLRKPKKRRMRRRPDSQRKGRRLRKPDWPRQRRRLKWGSGPPLRPDPLNPKPQNLDHQQNKP